MKALLFLFLPYVCFSAGLDSQQRLRADRLISVFENETLAVQYSYIANLKDGRGYTAGRAGFCTGCGDLLLVVKRYNALKPGNGLSKYTSQLTKLAKLESDSVTGLVGFSQAWKAAAKEELFRRAQDEISDQLYFYPSQVYADRLALRFSLSRVALYEAIIQHGGGNDYDSLGQLIARATAKARGAPNTGIDERVWLNAFLVERRADLLNPKNQDTKIEWRASVGRANVMLRIYSARNFEFRGPIVVNPYGTAFTLP